jgi:hypothetical protein
MSENFVAPGTEPFNGDFRNGGDDIAASILVASVDISPPVDWGVSASIGDFNGGGGNPLSIAAPPTPTIPFELSGFNSAIFEGLEINPDFFMKGRVLPTTLPLFATPTACLSIWLIFGSRDLLLKLPTSPGGDFVVISGLGDFFMDGDSVSTFGPDVCVPLSVIGGGGNDMLFDFISPNAKPSSSPSIFGSGTVVPVLAFITPTPPFSSGVKDFFNEPNMLGDFLAPMTMPFTGKSYNDKGDFGVVEIFPIDISPPAFPNELDSIDIFDGGGGGNPSLTTLLFKGDINGCAEIFPDIPMPLLKFVSVTGPDTPFEFENNV